MFKNIWFWLECSRVFSLPMTLFSWLVIFIYALKHNGNAIFGVLALIGIACAHLATNLFDDFVDYLITKKNNDSSQNTVSHKSKCRYITDGTKTLLQTISVVGLYCTIAMIIGAILLYFTGWNVLIFAILGGIIVLSYPILSSIGVSELAVALAFGPILFGGVYWVMTQNFSFSVFLLSIVVVSFTVGLLYTHNLLDFEADMANNKKTLCCRIGDANKALVGLILILSIGYGTLFFMIIFGLITKWAIITYLTLPLAIELYNSIKLYRENPKSVPVKHWWNFPFENWKSFQQQGVESFMFRLYQARNLMITFSILACVALILDKIC